MLKSIIERAIERIKRGIQIAVDAKDVQAIEELKITLEALENLKKLKASEEEANGKTE